MKAVAEIRKIVCYEFDIDNSMLEMNSREQEYLLPRQICQYVLRKYTLLSFKEIGQAVGNKDHATIIHSKDTMVNRITLEKKVREVVHRIERQFLIALLKEL